MLKLLLATGNPGKIQEFTALLRDLPFQLVSLNDVGINDVVDETGKTFHENAIIKARCYGKLSGLLTLSDDSGLVVDALDGRPGIKSARYGSPEFSDEERMNFLLQELEGIPWESRAARFVSVIAIVCPSGDIRTVEGTIEGIIQCQPGGDNGFGYDPVFYIPTRHCTTAQLSSDEKNLVSHRGKAARKAKIELEHYARNHVFCE